MEVPVSGLFATETSVLLVPDTAPLEVDCFDCLTSLVVPALLFDVDCVDCAAALILETPIVIAVLTLSPSVQQAVFLP